MTEELKTFFSQRVKKDSRGGVFLDTKVSIVMPVYNAEKHIRETIESILCQSYKNIEVICVDDGSTDSTVSILKEYADKDSRILIICQKNQYAGIARNNGLDHASGEYIMFLDSDDIFEKNMISYLVHKSKKTDADIIVFGYWRFIDSLKRRRPVRIHYKNRLLCSSDEIKGEILQITRSLPWDKFIKLEFLRKTGIRYQGTKVNNDIYFNRTLVTEAKRLYFTSRRFVNYRIENNNSLQGKLNKNPTDFVIGILGIYDELTRRGTISDFKESFDKIVLSDIIAHLRRVNTYSEYETIINCIIEQNLFDRLNIKTDSKIVAENAYKNMFISIYNKDVLRSFFDFYYITRNSTVPKDSIEYKIGHKIMEILQLTY